MAENFYKVAIPDRVSVLGLALRPFSLGHLITLTRLESPFVVEGKTDIREIGICALVCSLTYEGFQEAVDVDALEPFFNKWMRKIQSRGLFRRRSVPDFILAASVLREHISNGFSSPNISFDPNNFSAVSLPMAQLVKVTLMREFGMSESEALNRSMAQSLWDFNTIKAIDGHVKIMDDEAIKKAQDEAEALFHKLNATA